MPLRKPRPGPQSGAAQPRTVPSGESGRRFPGFDVFDQADTWDGATRAVVTGRLTLQPDLRFFTLPEEATASALFDRLLAQDGPPGAPKVPILQMIDSRLAEGQTDGWHHRDMPEDGEAWRRSLRGLDVEAAERYRTDSFAGLTPERQDELIEGVRVTAHETPGKEWHGMPVGHLWDLLMRYACTAFYAHPWAWNEIGFAGPAYPRGHSRLGVGLREPWEHPDEAPEDPAAPGGAEGRPR
ncbi:gluconate 2-dehydrogenase subunit 3 family protein [Streptomyces sp. NPDC046557]|uniref:gluconate 2-dehydrogenase subunit 3 family protein n=1 Tax=Streptomyces sp. NPDC046557 TaxID=3155372 RepID=UPI0033E70F41